MHLHLLEAWCMRVTQKRRMLQLLHALLSHLDVYRHKSSYGHLPSNRSISSGQIERVMT